MPAMVDIASTWLPRLPAAQSWLVRLGAIVPEGECRCNGFGRVPTMDIGRPDEPESAGAPLWDYLARMDAFAASASSTSLTHFAGKSELLEQHKLYYYLIAHLVEAIADCPHGTAMLVLMSLDVTERLAGMSRAVDLFALACALVVFSRHMPCRYNFQVVDVGFSGNMFVPYFRQLPMLLGLESRRMTCHPASPKIFMYESEPRWVEPLLSCVNSLASTEVWIHRLLAQSDCITDDPQDADLLFVPMYMRCLYSRKHRLEELGYGWEHPFTNATEWVREVLAGLGAQFRERPQDHVFVFPEERWPVSEEMFSQGGPLGRSIVLSPEARPLRCSRQLLREQDHGCEHMDMRTKGLIVVPSFVDGWRSSKLRAVNLPFDDRAYLGCFMGLGVKKPYSLTENFRALLRALADVPGFMISDYSDNYGAVMGNSIFCFVPKGVGTWSHRLYEVMLAGCVPVVLSDEVEMPFPEVPWQKFSVKWPMRRVDNVSLPRHLSVLVSIGKAAEMKREVDKHACWFDYHSEHTGCSPVHGITRRLADRGNRFGMKGFWGISKEMVEIMRAER